MAYFYLFSVLIQVVYHVGPIITVIWRKHLSAAESALKHSPPKSFLRTPKTQGFDDFDVSSLVGKDDLDEEKKAKRDQKQTLLPTRRHNFD